MVKKRNTKVYVFDLDDTLYMHRMKKSWVYHAKVKTELKKLKEKGKKLAMATHRSHPEELLDLLGIKNLFDVVISEKKPVHNLTHTIEEYTLKSEMMRDIMKILKCKKKHMLFFDDSSYNIKKVRDFKVKSILVSDLGIDFKDFQL